MGTVDYSSFSQRHYIAEETSDLAQREPSKNQKLAIVFLTIIAAVGATVALACTKSLDAEKEIAVIGGSITIGLGSYGAAKWKANREAQKKLNTKLAEDQQQLEKEQQETRQKETLNLLEAVNNKLPEFVESPLMFTIFPNTSITAKKYFFSHNFDQFFNDIKFAKNFSNFPKEDQSSLRELQKRYNNLLTYDGDPSRKNELAKEMNSSIIKEYHKIMMNKIGVTWEFFIDLKTGKENSQTKKNQLLQRAVEEGYVEGVFWLLEMGANPKILNTKLIQEKINQSVESPKNATDYSYILKMLAEKD